MSYARINMHVIYTFVLICMHLILLFPLYCVLLCYTIGFDIVLRVRIKCDDIVIAFCSNISA